MDFINVHNYNITLLGDNQTKKLQIYKMYAYSISDASKGLIQKPCKFKKKFKAEIYTFSLKHIRKHINFTTHMCTHTPLSLLCSHWFR